MLQQRPHRPAQIPAAPSPDFLRGWAAALGRDHAAGCACHELARHLDALIAELVHLRRERALSVLSPTERKVFDEMRTTDDLTPVIAERFHLAYATVKHHQKSIYAKLGIRSRDELRRL